MVKAWNYSFSNQQLAKIGKIFVPVKIIIVPYKVTHYREVRFLWLGVLLLKISHIIMGYLIVYHRGCEQPFPLQLDG